MFLLVKRVSISFFVINATDDDDVNDDYDDDDDDKDDNVDLFFTGGVVRYCDFNEVYQDPVYNCTRYEIEKIYNDVSQQINVVTCLELKFRCLNSYSD